MLQLVEMEGKMTENGCIEIPAVVLEQAGICTGDTVKLVYMAEDGELKNTAKEFLLARQDRMWQRNWQRRKTLRSRYRKNYKGCRNPDGRRP